MISLYFVFEGHYGTKLGDFSHIACAIQKLKEHQASSSSISNPYFHKSYTDKVIRIDYGAKHCWYEIEEAR